MKSGQDAEAAAAAAAAGSRRTALLEAGNEAGISRNLSNDVQQRCRLARCSILSGAVNESLEFQSATSPLFRLTVHLQFHVRTLVDPEPATVPISFEL